LRETLQSLNRQSLLPDLVVIVDSSDSEDSRVVVDRLQPALKFPLVYTHTLIRGAAYQRNLGAQQTENDLIFFLDDDVILEKDFLKELSHVFECDQEGRVGAVSGTITNQPFVPLSPLNRVLLFLFTGIWSSNLAGRVVGPGVCFLPDDDGDGVRQVEWLPTTGAAYRRSVFVRFWFDEKIPYPLEDLHLSVRVAQHYQLMNTSRARLFHCDTGRKTQRNWFRTGEGIILSRHAVAFDVLGRRGFRALCALFGYELGYTTLALLWNGGRRPNFRQVFELQLGKLRGAWRILRGQVLSQR